MMSYGRRFHNSVLLEQYGTINIPESDCEGFLREKHCHQRVSSKTAEVLRLSSKTASVMAVLKDCHERLLKDSSDQRLPK